MIYQEQHYIWEDGSHLQEVTTSMTWHDWYLDDWSNGLSSRMLSAWKVWDTLDTEWMEKVSFRGWRLLLLASGSVMLLARSQLGLGWLLLAVVNIWNEADYCFECWGSSSRQQQLNWQNPARCVVFSWHRPPPTVVVTATSRHSFCKSVSSDLGSHIEDVLRFFVCHPCLYTIRTTFALTPSEASSLYIILAKHNIH